MPLLKHLKINRQDTADRGARFSHTNAQAGPSTQGGGRIASSSISDWRKSAVMPPMEMDSEPPRPRVSHSLVCYPMQFRLTPRSPLTDISSPLVSTSTSVTPLQLSSRLESAMTTSQSAIVTPAAAAPAAAAVPVPRQRATNELALPTMTSGSLKPRRLPTTRADRGRKTTMTPPRR